VLAWAYALDKPLNKCALKTSKGCQAFPEWNSPPDRLQAAAKTLKIIRKGTPLSGSRNLTWSCMLGTSTVCDVTKTESRPSPDAKITGLRSPWGQMRCSEMQGQIPIQVVLHMSGESW
jgi:hypothetical protein